MPLYTYETTEGESFTSIWTITVALVKSLPSLSEMGMYALLWLFMRVCIVFAVVALLFSSLKDVIGAVRDYVRCKRNSSGNLLTNPYAGATWYTTRQFNGKAKGGKIVQLFTEWFVVVLIMNPQNIAWSTVIAIAIAAAVGFVIDKIANAFMKKALAA